nr:Chain C, GP41 PEPTIDE [Human immunodeficiency virus 1]
ECDKWCS